MNTNLTCEGKDASDLSPAVLKVECENTTSSYKVNIDDIIPCPFLPGRVDSGNIDSLVESIEDLGLLEPIIVMKSPRHLGKYERISGERRLDALKKLGLKTVECKVYPPLSPSEVFRIKHDENEERKDLSTYEKGALYEAWMKREGLSTYDLEKITGKDHRTISCYVRAKKTIDRLIREDSTLSNALDNVPVRWFQLIWCFDEYPRLQKKVVDAIKANPDMGYNELKGIVDRLQAFLSSFDEKLEAYEQRTLEEIPDEVKAEKKNSFVKELTERGLLPKAELKVTMPVEAIKARDMAPNYESTKACFDKAKERAESLRKAVKEGRRLVIFWPAEHLNYLRLLKEYASSYDNGDLVKFIIRCLTSFAERYPLDVIESNVEEN